MQQAYLIIAHNEFQLLSNLIKLLDYKNNDIYVHIDRKFRVENSDRELFSAAQAKIQIFSEYSVAWGDESQAQVEMFLLEKALEKKHDYYHIISGVDLPLKSNREIEDFLIDNQGKEFIQFEAEKINDKYMDRVLYRHYFSKYLKKPKYRIIRKVLFIVDWSLVFLQKLLGLKRKLDFEIIQKGCNWVTITESFAAYIVENREKICAFLKKSLCGDELFIQTLCMNSPFRYNLYKDSFKDDYESCLRNIIWNDKNRKSPKVYSWEDFENLKKSNCLFARKFSLDREPDFTSMWIEYIMKKNKGL